MVLAQPGARPAPAAVVRGVRAGRATGLAVIVDQHRQCLDLDVVIGVVVIFVRRLHRAADLVPALPPRRRRARSASRCWSTCATGSRARACCRRCRRAGTPSRRCARPAARRSPATSSWPPARRGQPARALRRRRLRQGRGGRHPRAAALRCVRRPAHRAAARRVPAGRQRLPPPPALGSRASRPRSTSPSTWRPATSRSAPPATRRPPSSGPAPAAGWCTSPRARCSGIIEDAEFDRRPRAVCDRGDAVLLYTDGMVETRGRDIQPRHRPDARPGRAAAAAGLRGRRPAADRRAGLAATTTGRCCWSTGADRRRGLADWEPVRAPCGTHF